MKSIRWIFIPTLLSILFPGCGPTLQQRKATIQNRQMVITQCAGPEIDARCIEEATKYSCNGRPLVMSMNRDLQKEAARAFGSNENRYYIVGECL
ncbi:MAG: hypothetical protein CMF59_03940 [Leptospiraceae bacterium]|nr:hypothetical protein [Leptospiraceae bacterium]